MKIIALMKCWSGEELLKASVLSIYNYVYKIVLLTSNISWIGATDNPSIPVIKELIKCHDPDKKIIHVNRDEINQIKHCMFGYKYIQDNYPSADYVQLIDSDEIFDNKNYKLAIQELENNPGFNAYRTNIYTYIKSPFYRINPIEPLKPVCFIKSNLPNMGIEPRGCAIKPFYTMKNVYYHHMVFVRNHFNKVLEKLIQSHIAEKQPYESMDKWIPEVWNNLPNVPRSWIIPRGGFHPAIGYGKNWAGIIRINLEDLPEVLHNKRFPEILKFGC